MKFSDFICFEATIPKLQAANRNDAITELVSALNKAGRLGKGKSQEITKAVIKREKEASTGLGKGVAVPHVKIPEIEDFVIAIGRSTKGVDFQALDEKPVHLVVMIGASDKQSGDYLKVLAEVIRRCKDKDLRREIMFSKTLEDIVDLFIQHTNR